jgi:hypothetical protein
MHTGNAKVEPQIGNQVGALELVFAHEQQQALRRHDHRRHNHQRARDQGLPAVDAVAVRLSAGVVHLWRRRDDQR